MPKWFIAATPPFLLVITIVLGYWLKWDWTGFKGKTLWDWLNLLAILAIPAVVGFGTIWITTQQEKVSNTKNIDNQQESALQAYIDAMSELLLTNQLQKSHSGDEVQDVARVRTLTVLRRLDGERKGAVVRFLQDTRLIDKNNPIIHLKDADLIGVVLRYANLLDAHLNHVTLSNAELDSVKLNRANLDYANLNSASLNFAELVGASLIYAILNDAELHYASLDGANLSKAELRGAKLSGASLENANLSGAKLHGADLEGAKLSGANLRGARLENANLRGTDLSGAKGADLTRSQWRHTNLQYREPWQKWGKQKRGK